VSASVQLPTWVAYLAGIGTPVAAFLGGLIGQLVTRKGARELEHRSRREQVMQALRWAAELAASDDEAKARLGVRQLRALADSNLSDPDVQLFVDAALETVVEELADEVDLDPNSEVQPAPATPGPRSAAAGSGDSDVQSDPDAEGGQR
jgi:hypothetical protein